MYLVESDVKVSHMNVTEDLLDNSVNSYLTRAAFRREENQYEQAIADYKHVLDLDPQQGDASFFMGICYERLEKKEEAIAAFTAAASLYEQQGKRQAGAARRWVTMLQTAN